MPLFTADDLPWTHVQGRVLGFLQVHEERFRYKDVDVNKRAKIQRFCSIAGTIGANADPKPFFDSLTKGGVDIYLVTQIVEDEIFPQQRSIAYILEMWIPIKRKDIKAANRRIDFIHKYGSTAIDGLVKIEEIPVKRLSTI